MPGGVSDQLHSTPLSMFLDCQRKHLELPGAPKNLAQKHVKTIMVKCLWQGVCEREEGARGRGGGGGDQLAPCCKASAIQGQF